MSQSANPLFTQWLKEILDLARERNTKGVNTYNRAYTAMRDCPITFTHPSEAKSLKGIGDTLCKTLERKLKEHCEENGLPMPTLPKGTKRANAGEEGDGGDTPSPPKKAKKVKAYVPALRSGSYAILLALSNLDEDEELSKQEIISRAQEYCDASFTVPAQANGFYTAWNTITTLINKNLVYQHGGVRKTYMLTADGWDCVKNIKAASDPTQGRLDTFVEKERDPKRGKEKSKSSSGDIFDLEPGSPSNRQSESPQKKGVADIVPLGSSASLPTFEAIKIPPGSFTVRLILDNREVRSKQDRDFIQKELYEQGVDAIVRPLPLGDTLWVAKMNDPDLLTRLGAEGDEILLDWIVERKRLDDLVASIKDRRFQEQKFRLRKTGVKNVVYVIEEFKMHNDHYEQHIQSAISSTIVVDGFTVQKTQTIQHTIKYLTRMTKMLKGIYESKTLHVIPTSVLTSRNYLPILKHLGETKPDTNFYITTPAFSSLASKSDSLTLRDVYLKMLMCTRGITGEKAIEIQKHWKTPAEFAAAYKNCGDDEQGKKRKMELVSGKMGNLVGRKKIAKTLSIKISEVWGEINQVAQKVNSGT